MTESLEQSNRVINISSATFLHDLENKSVEYSTEERAKVWMPKAKKIATLSKETYDYISGLKQQKLLSEKETELLYNKLINYKNDILAVDSSIPYEFASNIILTTISFDSLKSTARNFKQTLFNTNSEIATTAILTKFQNNIKIIENRTTAYCNAKVGSTITWFYSYSAIVGQNSNTLKPGDMLEIKAGIGAFSKAAQPKININGNTVELGEEGFSMYKMKVSKTPGNYKIPVRIAFFNQDKGKEESMAVNVEYTVTKECNQ